MTRPDTATLRRLGADYSCDPRSIARVLDGEVVRGMAGERALRAVEAWRAAHAAPKKRRTK